MKKRITFVGLDTHKNSIEVALADDGRNTEVRLYGSIGGDLASLDKMIRKLQATGTELRFVYEAGPCGYQIYRHLRAQGGASMRCRRTLHGPQTQWGSHQDRPA